MLVEKSINLFRFFHFIEMLSKYFYNFTFSLANIHINGDPKWTLTYLTAMLNLFVSAFVRLNEKNFYRQSN